MYKLCLLFFFVILSHEAHGFRIKRHWENKVGDEGVNWNWHGHFFKPNHQHQAVATRKPNSGSNSEDIIMKDCLQSCPVTKEYNPVCGTDNVTYDNPGRLLCAQTCGVNVTKLRASRCPDATITPAA